MAATVLRVRPGIFLNGKPFTVRVPCSICAGGSAAWRAWEPDVECCIHHSSGQGRYQRDVDDQQGRRTERKRSGTVGARLGADGPSSLALYGDWR